MMTRETIFVLILIMLSGLLSFVAVALAPASKPPYLFFYAARQDCLSRYGLPIWDGLTMYCREANHPNKLTIMRADE